MKKSITYGSYTFAVFIANTQEIYWRKQMAEGKAA